MEEAIASGSEEESESCSEFTDVQPQKKVIVDRVDKGRASIVIKPEQRNAQAIMIEKVREMH